MRSMQRWRNRTVVDMHRGTERAVQLNRTPDRPARAKVLSISGFDAPARGHAIC